MKRLALAAVAVVSPLLLAALLAGADIVFALLAAAFPVALMALGAARSRPARPVAALLAALLGLLVGSFASLIVLRGSVAEGPWPLGLPLSAWILLAGLWLLPLAVVPWLYARTFDRHGLSAEDLERVRRARPSSGESG